MVYDGHMQCHDTLIHNLNALATTPLRTDLLTIAAAGMDAIRTSSVIRRCIVRTGNQLTVGSTTYDLTRYAHLYVLAVGKCSLDAAVTLEEVLGDAVSDGVIIDVRGGVTLKRMRAFEGTHPYPSAQNAAHTKALLTLAEQATEDDLVIAIVSGGGSALLCQPESHTPVEETQLIQALFRAGATIEELNVVRKHLSKARGGYVAAAVHPATLAAVLFSDVPGDDVAVIASGPTVRDTTTRKDAFDVLEKYGLHRSFDRGHFIDTPKDPRLFAEVRNDLVLTNATALQAMRDAALQVGYRALIRDTRLTGEAREIGAMIAAELHTVEPRTVLLYGGETTVTIRGTGTGGRNQELSLGALEHLGPGEAVLSLASDGRDNTDCAGGIADEETRRVAQEHALVVREYLDANDSYAFFHTLRQGVETGYTGANVADLVIGITHGEPRVN